MVQQVIDVGVEANDGSGDSLYEAGNKINQNFEELFALTPVKADIKFLGNNITSRLSNADINLHPSGTGSIVFPGIRFNDNNIEVLNSNDDLIISANGSGKVIIEGLGFSGTTISSADSTTVNINENLVVDGDATFGGTFSFSGAQTFPTGTTFATFTLANGSITDSTGAISFGNENLTTTGTLNAGENSQFGNLDLSDGLIVNYLGGSISFGNENLSTTGTLSAATGSQFGNLDLLNGIINDSSGAISFGDENLTTTSTSMAINNTLTVANGSITDSTGAISFGDDNVSTTGNLSVDGTSTFGALNVGGATSLAFPVTVDNLTFNDNIITTSSNADLNLSPGGTGVVNVSNMTIDSSINLTDNVIKVTTSNADLILSANGSGSVQIEGIDLEDGTIDNVVIGANEPSSGLFDPLNYTTLVIPTKLTFSGNTISTSRSNDNLEFEASGSGKVVVNGLALPNSDGETGQMFQTDGSGTLSFGSTGIALEQSDIQDTRQTIGFTTETVIDANLATGENESITGSTSMINDYASSKYDSAWYIALSRLEGADSAIEFQMQKHILARGTEDGSTFDAFSGSSQIIRTSGDEEVLLSSDIRSSSDKVRLLGAGGKLADGSTTSAINTLHFFRIGLGDDDSSGTQAGSSTFTQQQTLLVADLDSAASNLDTFSASNFRGAKYFISINNTTTNEVSCTEVLVVHNGTDAFVTEYNTLITNAETTPLATFTADISGGNVRLRGANGTAGTCRVTMYRILLSDSESARSGTPISIVGSTSIGQITTTELDPNVTTITSRQGFETAELFDEFSSATYNSVWYHTITKDMNGGRLSFHKYSVNHGTSDDSSIEAFISDSGVVRSEEFDTVTADVNVDDGNIQLKLTGVDDGSTTISSFANTYRIGLGDNTTDSSTGGVATEDGIVVSGISETKIDHVTAVGDLQGSIAATRTASEFTASEFNGALYFLVTRDLANGSFETQKVSVLHNFNDAFLTSSAVTSTDEGDTHPTFDADVVTSGDSSSKVRLRMTDNDGSSVTPSNTLNYFRIGIGDDDSTGYVGELGLFNDITHVDIIDSSTVTLNAIAHGSHPAAKYFINVKNQATGETGNMEALVTHNGSDAFITVYNEHFSGNNSLLTLTADIDGTSFRLRGSATAGGSTKVIVNRIIAFGDSESDETNSDSTRKIIGNTIVSSSATEFDSFESQHTDAAHYVITGQKGSTENFICEAMVVTDGTNVFVSQGPNTSSKSTDMLEISATISSGIVSVKASSTSGATTVQAFAIKLKAPLAQTQTLDSFAHADYRGAKYYVSATSTSNSGTMNAEALVVHDGTTAYITVYNDHFTKAKLFTLEASISGSNLVVTATGLVPDTTIRFYRIRLADDQSAATPRSQVKVISAVTVSSTATTLDTFSTNTDAAAHYIIIGSASDGKSIMEATVISDGTEASVAEGPQVSTKGTLQLQLSASHSSTTTTLQASSTSGGSTTVNAYRILLPVPSGTQYTEIDSFAHASTQGAMYIAVTNQTDAKAEIDEFMVVTDGTDAYNLRFGINSDSATTDIVNWTTVVDGTNVSVRAQLADARAQGTITAWQVHLDRAAGNPSNIATLDTFDKTEFRSAAYNVSISDPNAGTLGNYEMADVRVTHDGTTPYVSVFGRTNSSSDDLVTFTADIDGDNVRLRGQISSSNTHELTVVKRVIKV